MNRIILLSLILLLVTGGVASAADPNLISRWKFNEGSGSTAYDSIGDNNGTIYGASWTTGQVGGALDFDGSGDYVDVADSASLSFTEPGLTIAAWVYLNQDQSGERAIVRKNNQWGLGVYPANNKIRNLVQTDGINGWTAANDESYTINTDTWYFFAFTYDGSVLKHYANGVQVGSDKTVTGDIVDNSNKVAIGSNTGGASNNVNGKIDDVRIYNRALTAEEIWQLYLEVFKVIGLEITGPEKVIENSTAQYAAVASYEDGSMEDVTSLASWSVQPQTIASIDANGLLATGRIVMSGNITIYAEYTKAQISVDAEKEVQIALPVGLEITGPGSVREDYQSQYNAIVYYDNGQSSDVTDLVLWQVEPQTIASIDDNGLLQTEPIDEEQDIIISAEYTCSGVTVEVDMAVGVLEPPYIWRVPSNHETIQAAIDYSIDGEEIIVADGTYTGEGNRDIDFLGKAITLRSENGPQNCIIDCNAKGADEHRGFYFHNGEDANSVVDGFTIIRGYDADDCGGIFCVESNPTITNCIISDNDGFYCGGIYCYYSGRLIIDNCIISSNGCGIYFWHSAATVTNCVISGNWGNGIYGYESDINVTNCTLSDNSGYGARVLFGNNLFNNCIVWGNTESAGIWRDATVSYSNIQKIFLGEGNINVEPMLEPDGYHLRPYSPCINAGDPEFDPGAEVTDIDGDPRVVEGRVDMGADEYPHEWGQLIEIEITGLTELVEGATAQYTATAYYEGGYMAEVTATTSWWLVPNSGASIEAGLLQTEQIEQTRNITIHASYTEDDITAEAELTVFVHSSVIYVPAEYETIQEAIDAAHDGVTVIVADGTYMGEGNTDIWFRGKAITVRSENGPENCIIDGNNEWRTGLEFRDGEDANSVLDGFTITNCRGSGILCPSSPTIRNCIITGNSRGYGGGGIDCYSDGKPTIVNCIISRNTVRRYGGGIYCGYGSNPIIVDCIISGNEADSHGGGIYCYYGGNPTFINCTISGNLAKRSGGGIYCRNHGNPTLTNCIISGNRATRYDGGGIYCQRSSPTLTNSIISGNTAEDEGGGIYFIDSGGLTVNHCTVAANVAKNSGGGILCGDDSLFGLSHCILWDNSDDTGTGQLSQIQGGRPDVIYSCIQDDDANDTYIPFSDANGNIDDRPMFVRAPDDGGDGWGDDPCTPAVDEGANDDFGDVHLRVVSPCIDSGLPDFVAGVNAVDMDGQPRVMGLDIDMGADEYEKFIIVTEPEGGEVWAAGSTHDIEWSSYGAGQVDIMLSKNAGGSWQSIEDALSDTGSYSWHILNKYCSEQVKVKVVPSEPDANVICIESRLFSIVPYEGPVSVPRRKKEPRYKPVAKYGPEFGCVKWKLETDGPVTAGVTIGREIDKQRKVYAACEDGKLYALDLETGALIWSYDVNSPLVGSAAEGLQGSVYVGGRDGMLYALDKEGELLWTHSTDAPIYSSAVVSPQQQIYVCSEDGMLYALKRNGSELWRYETGGFAKLDGSIFATLQIAADGTIYIAGLYDPNLYALNPKDGSVKWRCNFAPHDPCAPSSGGRRSSWPFASPAVAPDGTIYQMLSYDPNLYAIEPDMGTIIWSTNLAGTVLWYEGDGQGWPPKRFLIWYGPGEPPEYIGDKEVSILGRANNSGSWSKPAIGPDGTIYVNLEDAYLQAVNPDGSRRWFTKLGELGGFTLTVGDDGLIYAANDDNNLYVVEPEGAEIARFEGDGWLSHPVIAPGHTIIVSDANNTVWAITQQDCGDKPIVLDVPPEPNEPNEP